MSSIGKTLKGLLVALAAGGFVVAAAVAADKDQPGGGATKTAAKAADKPQADNAAKAGGDAPRQAASDASKAADRATTAKPNADQAKPQRADDQNQKQPSSTAADRANDVRSNATSKAAATAAAARDRTDNAANSDDRRTDDANRGNQRDDRTNVPQRQDAGQDGRRSFSSDRRDGDDTKVNVRNNVNVNARNRIGVQFNSSNRGLAIASIAGNSAFASFGLRTNDVIVSGGGRRFDNSAMFYDWVATVQPGQRIPIVVLRDGQEQTLYWTPTEEVVAQFSQDAPAAPANFLGIHLDDQVQDAAVVAEVEPNSPAQRAGVRANDVIMAVNGNEVASPADFHNAAGQTPPNSAVELAIARTMHLQVTPGGGQKAAPAAAPRSAAVAPPAPTTAPAPPAPAVVPAPRPVVVPVPVPVETDRKDQPRRAERRRNR